MIVMLSEPENDFLFLRFKYRIACPKRSDCNTGGQHEEPCRWPLGFMDDDLKQADEWISGVEPELPAFVGG